MAGVKYFLYRTIPSGNKERHGRGDLGSLSQFDTFDTLNKGHRRVNETLVLDQKLFFRDKSLSVFDFDNYSDDVIVFMNYPMCR